MQKLTLNTESLSRDRLAVVQKVDSAVRAIILTTPHVAVYVFKVGKWERKNIEGPLYLVRRSQAPEFSLLVLNRKGPNHMVELLTEHYEFNDQEPYVIFRDSKAPTPTPHGMWFKSSEDRNKLWKEIQNINALLLQQKGQSARGSSSIGASISGGKGFAHKGGGPDISPQQIHECIQSSNQINHQVQQMVQQQRQMHAQIQQQQQILQQQQMRIQQQQVQLSAFQVSPLQVQPQISGLTSGQVELSVAQLQKILMRMVQDERFVVALHAQYIKAQRKKRAAATAAGQ